MTKKAHQPRLVSEPEAAYNLSPEEEARKEAYRERLREYLQDPEFRATPGFPIADDEAILALSDPPYYTACPNPFLSEIVAEWQAEREEEEGDYHREPFASDVSEGKNNPIYNAHSYHTKVPHPAIMRYILHYTEPGDIVFDGFAGTGMTGVAAQLCGDRAEVEKLGYRIDEEGKIYDPAQGKEAISKLGARKAILNDLSPAASFIAYNYNTPVDAIAFEREAQRILNEVEEECGWMYETLHSDDKTKGKINYTVWSDVFICPQCGEEMVFWDVAVGQEKGEISSNWPCPSCGVQLSKSPRKDAPALRIERAFETKFDRAISQTIRQAKQVPVLINYSIGKKRFDKRPDLNDLALIEKIETRNVPYPFPTNPIPKGDKTSDPFSAGLTHVHHFYTHRNLSVLAALINAASHYKNSTFLYILSSINLHVNKMRRYQPVKPGGTPNLPGTLYISALPVELSLFNAIPRKLRNISKALMILSSQRQGNVALQACSAENLLAKENCIDYIFVDPPFGSNLMYSELNYLWEAWLGVITSNQLEAIVNKTQSKGLPEYNALMEACFRNSYYILKFGV